MLAFVPTAGLSLRARPRAAARSGRRAVVVARRDLSPKHLETTHDNSAWRDNAFCGGFPGGELYLNKWIEGGMVEDVPELEAAYQPSAGVKENVKEDLFCHPLLGYCWPYDDDSFSGLPAAA
mmetsp:Transcript_32790/g.80359  ORF Transcript_32790/g.80359 Transcript_32790/m.80359 type:complete len:122 (+) Transcript_32790:140-505(+)